MMIDWIRMSLLPTGPPSMKRERQLDETMKRDQQKPRRVDDPKIE